MGRSVVSRYLAYAVSLLALVILARLFTPEEFGVVAAIQVAFTLAMMISESGFGPAIINLKRLEAADRNGIYSVTIMLGLGLGSVVLLLGGAIARLYGIAAIERIVPYVALALGFAAASIVPEANLQRDQRFYAIGAADVAAEVVGTTVALVLLPLVDPLHALAARMPAKTMSRWLMMSWMSRDTEFGRPRLGVRLAAVRPLLAFSTFQFGFNVINFFSRNLDNVLVGKYLGPVSLGVYDKAYQLMRYPLMMLTFAMTPAIQPVIRHHAEDPATAEAIHSRFVVRMAWLGLVAGAVLLVGARWIVAVLLGPGWDQVVPVIRVLAVAVPVQVVASTSGSFFQAMGRTGLLFLSGLLSAAVTIGAMAWGIAQGDLVDLTWALVLAFHVNFVQAYWILYRRVFAVSPAGMFLRMLAPGTVVAAMALWLLR